MKYLLGFLLIFILNLNIVFALLEGNRVLVLLDDLSLRQSHSIFFKNLQDRGYDLTFKSAEDPILSLTEYGEYQYDHLIIFAPHVEEFGGLVDVTSILDFIDDGHNVILAASSSLSDPVREIASECGAEFDVEGSYVIDHFNYHKESVDHTTIVINSSNILDTPIITGSKALKDRKPIIFEGIGHTIQYNGLNIGVLKGFGTTYSANLRKSPEEFHSIGEKTILVSVLQARNNARVLISGSLSLFANRYFTKKTDNEYFADELSKWVFKERGVLRASNVTHHKVGEKSEPQTYTVKDRIEYSLVIEEWDGSKWVPYIADDVQVEFSMLDPYIRAPLKADKGKFKIETILPDVYGVFSFKIDYKRLGYTNINVKNIVPVRPFRHDEYPRFLRMAYPYYLSSISMVGGVILLTIFLLFTKAKK